MLWVAGLALLCLELVMNAWAGPPLRWARSARMTVAMLWMVSLPQDVWTLMQASGKAMACVWLGMQQFLARLEDGRRDLTATRFIEDPATGAQIPAPSIIEEPTKTLSVVLPAYNESLRLGSCLDSMLRYPRRDEWHHLRRGGDTPPDPVLEAQARQRLQYSYELIVVDDGSKDDTHRVIRDYSRKHGVDTVRCLKLPKNMGKGQAVKAGMVVARGQTLLMADSDGATNPEDLPLLEAELQKITQRGATTAAVISVHKQQDLGMAIGSRAHLLGKARAERAPHRNLLTYGFHLLVWLAVGSRIKDTQCGFKLFTRRTAKLLFSNQRLRRWCFDAELIYLAQQFRVPLVEVPVRWTEVPGSKIRTTSILHMAWELLAIVWGYRITGLWRIRPDLDITEITR